VNPICIGANDKDGCDEPGTITVFVRKEADVFTPTEFMMCLEHGKNGGNTIGKSRYENLRREDLNSALTREEWNALYDWVTGRALMDAHRVEVLTRKALAHIASSGTLEG
jgi:hypothetical protein